MLDRYVLVGRNRHQLWLLVHGERAIILNYAQVGAILPSCSQTERIFLPHFQLLRGTGGQTARGDHAHWVPVPPQ